MLHASLISPVFTARMNPVTSDDCASIISVWGSLFALIEKDDRITEDLARRCRLEGCVADNMAEFGDILVEA
jgi:hypothetical protein